MSVSGGWVLSGDCIGEFVGNPYIAAICNIVNIETVRDAKTYPLTGSFQLLDETLMPGCHLVLVSKIFVNGE